MTVTIRRLLAADAPAYRAIRLEGLQLAPEAFGGSYEEEAATPVERVADGLTRNVVLGASTGGEDLAGVAGVFVRPAARLAHKAVLFGMYVRPAARRRGVGAALLASAVAAVRAPVEEIQLSVVTSNRAACALYRAAGFRRYGFERCALKVGDTCHDEYLMALRLVDAPRSREPASGAFRGPVKRSITIAGHETSISLEPVFWAALETAAQARDLPISALVAQVDASRIAAPQPANLASALRSWLFAERA